MAECLTLPYRVLGRRTPLGEMHSNFGSCSQRHWPGTLLPEGLHRNSISQSARTQPFALPRGSRATSVGGVCSLRKQYDDEGRVDLTDFRAKL
jgi:hypothetical protein